MRLRRSQLEAPRRCTSLRSCLVPMLQPASPTSHLDLQQRIDRRPRGRYCCMPPTLDGCDHAQASGLPSRLRLRFGVAYIRYIVHSVSFRAAYQFLREVIHRVQTASSRVIYHSGGDGSHHVTQSSRQPSRHRTRHVICTIHTTVCSVANHARAEQINELVCASGNTSSIEHGASAASSRLRRGGGVQTVHAKPPLACGG